MVFQHRRFVALCRVRLFEILDLALVILLPALPRRKPRQHELHAQLLLSLMPGFGMILPPRNEVSIQWIVSNLPRILPKIGYNGKMKYPVKQGKSASASVLRSRRFRVRIATAADIRRHRATRRSIVGSGASGKFSRPIGRAFAQGRATPCLAGTAPERNRPTGPTVLRPDVSYRCPQKPARGDFSAGGIKTPKNSSTAAIHSDWPYRSATLSNKRGSSMSKNSGHGTQA